jgi:hypothetical protein
MVQPLESLTEDLPLRQHATFKQAAFVLLLLATGQVILQVSLLARGVEYVASSLSIDDTYYYLQTAWNTKQLGFVTFDGLHPTNGVQFLWFVIILLLALLANTKIVLLFATMVVSFLLNGLCYLFIFKIGVILKQPILALFMAGLWSLQSLPFRIYSTGMENSLHAFVFWCVIWQSTIFLIRVQDRVKPNIWELTLVLILNVWTRLDSALLSAVLYIFCMVMFAFSYRNNFKLFLQKHLKVIAGSSLFAGFGLFIQLSAFRLMGDSFLPVSALIKTNGSIRGLSSAAADKLVEVVTLGMPSILQGRFPTLILILLGIFSILLVIRARIINPSLPKEILAFLNLWTCLLVGETLYQLYIAISGVQYTLYFIWYRSPSFIFWIITLSLIALFTSENIKPVKQLFNAFKWAPIGFSLLLFAVAIYMFERSINFTSNLYVARYDAALWIAENFPPDAVFAAWNTGQLGFFSNRTFINLDGVINNVDYYERVLRGSVSLTNYLSENRVDYIVDYDTYDSIPEFPVIHSFPLNDESGRSITIWQVTPQITSNQ